MRLDAKKFFLAFFFFIATLIGLAYYHFQQEQVQINHSINTNLIRAAESAQIIIGDAYHDRILSTAPTAEQDYQTIQTLSSLANAQGVKYIYSIILDKEGKLRFTSSSAQHYELISGQNLTRFFDTYPDNKDILQALKNNETTWDMKETTDQWGKFRSVFVPGTSANGVRYIIGADIEIQSIQKLSNAAAFKAIGTSLVIFLGALPFLLIYRNTLMENANFMRERFLSATDELREVNEILETKVEEKTKQLISQSFEDALTSLPNRHRLQYDMDKNTYSTLMILNLYNFREINDFFGFAIGDDLIRQMGHWLHALDLNPYRLSGDEFAILFTEEMSRDAVETLTQRLLIRLNQHPFRVADETVTLSVTIGIDMGANISLSHADIALHEAKDHQSHIAFYNRDSHIEEQFKVNIALASTIHKALKSGRIICFYQPIVSLQTGKIEKYETLVRMIDESANIIPPLDFLKIAQKTRIYPEITRTVVEHACHTFKSRNEQFSINLSIRDIIDPHTVRFIEEMMIETDTAHQIVFEILESEGIDNFDKVIAFVDRMKALGAQIAIDDYGTGYSSLENILRLKVDYLKIDGSLIQNVISNTSHALAVQHIASLANDLGIKTVAEYVSSEEIYNRLQIIGITYAQGYYTGKPAPITL